MLEQRETATKKALEALPFGAPVEKVMGAYRRDGGLILEGVLTEAQVAQINADLDAELAALHCGTIKADPVAKVFWGERTKRITNAVTLSKTYRDCIVDSDTTMAYVSEIYREVSDTLWLNSSQAIEIHPGETAQPLHRDMANYPIFFRYGPSAPEVMVNMLVALSDCTEAAGATRVIPGSHTWPFTEQGSPDMTIAAELKPGSALLFGGKLIHVVRGAKVALKVVAELEKGEKLDVYKFKAKSRYKKHTGFRPQYSRLLVGKISL